MQTFKKVILSSSLFAMFFLLVSAIVIEPYYNSESVFYQDAGLRKSLAGSIDYVVIGASHALTGFDTRILDNELECNSYNMSGNMMPMAAKYFLLKKELSRNNIDTVVLEISNDTLQRNSRNEYANGDEPVIARLENCGERLDYMIHCVEVDDWLNIYSRSFVQGLTNWVRILKNNTESAVNYELKGFYPKDSVDITLSKEAAKNSFATCSYGGYNQENYDYLMKIVEICHQKNVRVIIAVVPISDGLIWKYNNSDDIYSFLQTFSNTNDCCFLDFNLLKTRYSDFNDAYSFADADHLSSIGAATFTERYVEIIKAIELGADISEMFYFSYSEMIEESPYQTVIICN